MHAGFLFRLCLIISSSAVVLASSRAVGCASCGCGDPALTAMGMEKPFTHRVRLSLEQRAGVHSSPAQQERTLISRTALSGSYSPTAFLSFAALLPFFAAHTQTGQKESRTVYGIGDFELMARGLIFRDRSFSPRHLVGVLAGIKTPTGPRRTDSSGYPASSDMQPGSGSWDGLFGAQYSYFGESVALLLSASYRLSGTGYVDYRRGSVLGATAVVQIPVVRSVAINLGMDTSWTAQSVLSSGVLAPNTGGLLASLTYGVLIAVRPDWLLRFQLQTPVIQRFVGSQAESPTGILSLTVDL